MEHPFENPFDDEPVKPRKPGVAGLVGEVFGEKAEAAYAKRVSEGKKQRSAPQENWEGVDITMSAKEKAEMDIERNHVRLQNIPTFTGLPNEDEMKKDFSFDSFDWIWEEEYQVDRPVTDFTLTDAGLESVGLDEHSRFRILEAMAKAKETPPLAKVFDIGDVIKQKQQADPKHPDSLSTKEVLEAIDAAGYRPATLQELFAYSRDHWQPDVDPDGLSDIYAFGAPFLDSSGERLAPCLFWQDSERHLGARVFAQEWISHNRFLVFRKGSS